MAGFAAGNYDTLQLGGSSTGNVISGVISDAAGGSITAGGYTPVTVNSSGTWTLNGANTYDGPTTLTAGTLGIGNASALGTSAVAINGGTFIVTGGNDLSINNNVTLGGGATFGVGNSLTVTGTFTNSGSNTLEFHNSTAGHNVLTLSGNIYLSSTLAPPELSPSTTTAARTRARRWSSAASSLTLTVQAPPAT